MPDPDVIGLQVQRILGEHFNFMGTVQPRHRIMADLGGDSLDAVEVVMKLEDHYNIDLDGVLDDNDPMVGDIIAAICKAAA